MITEKLKQAEENYEKAANLHKISKPWSYLAPNYFAWGKVEKAESLSRKEKTQQAKEEFQKAIAQFSRAKESIKQKIQEIESEEEKIMALGLVKSSELRAKYCQARILVEEAKLLDKTGNRQQG